MARRVGSLLGQHQRTQYFEVTIPETTFTYARKEAVIQKPARLDGLYAIRTHGPESELTAEEAVLSYQQLSKVEPTFRQLKTVDLKVRPIPPFSQRRMEPHFFIGMLAEYVRGPLKARRAPLLLAEEDPDGVTRERVVAPAERSEAPRQKVTTKTTPYGTRAMNV